MKYFVGETRYHTIRPLMMRLCGRRCRAALDTSIGGFDRGRMRGLF
jgi:hypothetical protein